MELVNGVSLLAYLKAKPNRRIEENECKQIFFQIVKGIAHCHSRSICHRDIKLENIIVEETKFVKIIDFGFGTVISENKLCNFFCGTPSYMPPEIVQKRDYIGKLYLYNNCLGQYADIWSLGILLYTLLCGAFPFRALNEKELYSKITKGVYNFPDHMSSSACDLVRRILNLTPAIRPTAEEVKITIKF
jgi:MAP/microtubule affinity-regulating kinase